MKQIKILLPKHYLLHQIHSSKIVPAKAVNISADGHFTSDFKKGLIIKTADCLPVMIESSENNYALHIGWRGLAKKILSVAISQLTNKKNIKLWIGPHVQKKNYFLNKKNISKLFQSHNISINEAASLGIIQPCYEKQDQYLISLKNLLLNEAYALGVKTFICSDTDTYTSHNHFSHRRNPYRRGTNYSFILKR